MLKNYLTTAWRNMAATRGYTAINVLGLAIGMAVAMLIGVWLFDELSFNRSFEHYDRLAQVYHNITFDDEIITIPDVPAPIAEALGDYAGIEAVTLVAGPSDQTIAMGEHVRTVNGIVAESEFCQMFSLHIVQGTGALDNPQSILISESLASSLPGGAVPGTVVKLGESLVSVAGVYRDFVSNSTFAGADLLIPMEFYESASEENDEQLRNWEDFSFQCFVLLDARTSAEDAGQAMRQLLFENMSDDGKALRPEGFLFPMSRWHLFGDFNNGTNTGGRIRSIRMFGAIGVFVLLLACINFINLSTARSEKRAKEVGMRKTMGSSRWQLIFQFLSESLLTVAVSFVIATGIVALALPWFSSMAGRTLMMPWMDWRIMLGCVAFVGITGVLAGSYPAFFLSSFRPVKALKGALVSGAHSALPRSILVVFQFVVSAILIAGTLVVYLQIRHGQDRPVGFDREGIFYVEVRTEGLANADYNALRHELLATGVVNDMAMSDHPVTGSMAADASLTWDGKDPSVQPLFALNSCTHDFPKTNGFQFVEGRDFSRAFATDSLAVIVNEMGAKLLAPNGSAVGKKIRFGYGPEREVVGVIRDQVRWSPFTRQSPHLYYVNYSIRDHLTVRLVPGADTQSAVAKVEGVVKQFDPSAPFNYEFLGDDYEREFHDTQRFGLLAGVFATLAVFISCIGVFGLSAFAAARRTKEIGVRKVLGASLFRLWTMLCNDFLRLAIVSVVVGLPLAYYFANRWLEQYEYRITLGWWMFAATGALILVITLLTVSYQSLRAARMNPAKTLRAE